MEKKKHLNWVFRQCSFSSIVLHCSGAWSTPSTSVQLQPPMRLGCFDHMWYDFFAVGFRFLFISVLWLMLRCGIWLNQPRRHPSWLLVKQNSCSFKVSWSNSWKICNPLASYLVSVMVTVIFHKTKIYKHNWWLMIPCPHAAPAH